MAGAMKTLFAAAAGPFSSKGKKGVGASDVPDFSHGYARVTSIASDASRPTSLAFAQQQTSEQAQDATAIPKLIRHAFNGKLAKVRKYVEQKRADIEQTGTEAKMTSVIAAASNDKQSNLPVVTYLLGRKANIEAATCDGYTALMMAAAKGHLDVVQLLVDRGAKLSRQNSLGQTAWAIAREQGHSEVAAFLAGKMQEAAKQK